MRKTLTYIACIILIPIWIGAAAHLAVQAFIGEAPVELGVGLALLFITLIWERVESHREKPKSFNVVGWTDFASEIEIELRAEDGAEKTVTIKRGANVTTGAKA